MSWVLEEKEDDEVAYAKIEAGKGALGHAKC